MQEIQLKEMYCYAIVVKVTFVKKHEDDNNQIKKMR